MAVAAAGAAFDRFAPRQEATTNSASSTSLTQSPASSSSSTSTSSNSNSIATTPTTTTSSTSSSASPFFPDPSTRVDPPNSSSEDSGLPKTVLEWIFLTLAILLVFALIIRRLNQLKIHSRPLNEFFSFRRHRISARRARSRRSSRHSRQSSSSSITSPYASPYITAERARSQIPRTHFLAPYPRIPPASYSSPSANAGYNIDLAGVPSSAQLSQLARHGSLALSPRTRTRTRAVNVDEGGRRLDSVPQAGDEDYGYGSSDGHGEKDDLPAYDKHGGPPGYVEVQFPGMITGVGAGGGRGTTTTATAQEGDGGGAGGMLRRLGMGPLGLLRCDNNRNTDVERDAERNAERRDDTESEESQLQHGASPSPSPPPSSTPAPAPSPTLSTAIAGTDTRMSEDTDPTSTSTTTTTIASPPTDSASQAEPAHNNSAS
ncbi:hypothetical protein VKT23_019799 [Stygiomarasmius scandens]|uniref:Uncharacterized protein n=1 Tax=Marasmiellus scandens TaxID=2682957 RepID=A0ABR1IP67_9AGAR